MSDATAAIRAGETVLSISGVSKQFGGVQALNNVSLELAAGEVLALAGDNGAGKSTLVKVVSGVHQPDAGVIRFRGAETSLRAPREARRLGIETIYQDLALCDNLDIGANVFLGREPLRRQLGFLPAIDKRGMEDAAKSLLERLDIDIEPDKIRRPVAELSGGQRQAVAVARAMYWRASLLIMDEPTAALGVPEQRKVKALIRRLKRENVAVIFISHNLVDIFEVSDRILVLRRGVVAGQRNVAATNADEIVRMMVGGV
jgi:ABC-type sugar transport system ATPase subunit